MKRKLSISEPLPNVYKIFYHKYLVQCLHYSAYPVARFNNLKRLYICHKTFKYMRKPTTYKKYLSALPKITQPPGKLLYKRSKIELYLIDGEKHVVFCTNLCLLSKLFIKHKNTRYDPKPFYFYVLVERQNEMDFVNVGYFSVEKMSQHNLSCVLVLPPFQGKGYGRLLVSISYDISAASDRVGSPEKPLSSSAKKTYRSFWSFKILQALKINFSKEEIGLSLTKLSEITKLKREDIMSTLSYLGFIKTTKAGIGFFFNREVVNDMFSKFENKYVDSISQQKYFIKNQ